MGPGISVGQTTCRQNLDAVHHRCAADVSRAILNVAIKLRGLLVRCIGEYSGNSDRCPRFWNSVPPSGTAYAFFSQMSTRRTRSEVPRIGRLRGWLALNPGPTRSGGEPTMVSVQTAATVSLNAERTASEAFEARIAQAVQSAGCHLLGQGVTPSKSRSPRLPPGRESGTSCSPRARTQMAITRA